MSGAGRVRIAVAGYCVGCGQRLPAGSDVLLDQELRPTGACCAGQAPVTASSPADTMRQAAAVLAVAEAADRYPGPAENEALQQLTAEQITRADMHSGVRRALAVLLENAAIRLDASTHPEWQAQVAPHALAVARAILGEGPEADCPDVQTRDAPPREPHPTQADMDAALAVIRTVLGEEEAGR